MSNQVLRFYGFCLHLDNTASDAKGILIIAAAFWIAGFLAVVSQDVWECGQSLCILKVGDAGGSADMTNTMLQKFWDSAFALEPPEDDDTHSDISVTKSSADNCGSDHTKSSLSSSFAFKLEDSQGRVHRFHCGTESLAELKSAVLQRVGVDGRYLHQITYEDEEGDCVVLATDNDLAAAVSHAKMLEWKGLRLHLEYGQSHARSKDRNWPSQTKLAKSKAADLEMGIPQHGWGAAYTTAAATGAAIMLGISLVMFLKRSNA